MQHHIVLKPSAEFYGLTISSTSRTLDSVAAVPSDAVQATIQFEGASVRGRFDGTAPTTTVGFKFVSGVDYEIRGWDNLTALKLIRATTDDATMNVIYQKAQ